MTKFEPTPVRVLRTEAEYEDAVAEIDALLDADPSEGSEAYDRLEFLSLLVEAYETEHYPMPAGDVTSQAVVEFMLEQKGLDRTALHHAMLARAAFSSSSRGRESWCAGRSRRSGKCWEFP